MGFALGIDIGGTFTKLVVMGEDRRVLGEGRLPTEAAAGPAPLVDRAAAACRQLCTASGLDASGARAVGVGIAGLVNSTTGVLVAAPNLAGWERFAVADAFAAAFGCPAAVENDANAFALGEATLGAGRDCDPVALITLGTGVGGGLVAGGRIVRGRHGYAGEFGHMALTVDQGPRCACGARGCVEAYLRSSHVVALALELAANGTESPSPTLARALAAGEATARTVGEAAREGDPVALAVFRQLGRYLGIAIANIISAFNPQVVIAGGGVALAGEVLLTVARQTALARVLPPLAADVSILPAALGDQGGVLGAGLLALAYEPTSPGAG